MAYSKLLEKIIVDTGLAKKTGIVRERQDAVSYEDLSKVLMNSKAKYIAIIPDINNLLADLIIPKILDMLKIADAVIVVVKPIGILSRLLTRLGGLDILKKLTGHPRGYLIVFKRGLIKDLKEFNDVNTILSNATRVIELSYDIPLVYYIVNIYSKLPYPLLLAIREPWRILKFALVGLLGSIVNVSVVELTSMLLDIQSKNMFFLLIPGFTGFEVSLTTNFILHELWTFRDMNLPRKPMSILKRYLKYHGVSIASLLSQLSSIFILTGFFGVKIGIAAFIGIVLGFLANYILGRLFTWSPMKD